MEKDEKDLFWDLERLLPKKHPVSKSTSPVPHTELPTVQVPASEPPHPESVYSLTRARKENATDRVTYTPSGNRFIRSVTVTSFDSSYSFYALFRSQAAALLPKEGKKDTPFVPYFSYIAQYSQLSPAQMEYYLTFRSAVRRREKIKTDFSYIMLLVYEILNLPVEIPPKDGISMICYLYTTYREDFPRLDKYLAVWIPDYCLIHKLPCPSEELSPILPYVLAEANFKEFYLGFPEELDKQGLHEILSLVSDYHWRYSRYATGDALPVFEEHTEKILFPLVKKLLADEKSFASSGETVKEYDAFSGSLAAHNIRRRLTVVYRPFTHTPRFRRVLTASVKYCENKIRALLGIRARLGVADLPDEYRVPIDEYFASLVRKKKKDVAEARPSYESLYDVKNTGLSFADAAKIEGESWETTRALVPEEDAEEVPVFVVTEPTGIPDFDEKNVSDPDNATAYPLSEAAVAFLSAVSVHDDALCRRVAKGALCAEETLAEEINTYFTENHPIGDSVLYPTDTGFSLYEDYESEVSEWLKTMK